VIKKIRGRFDFSWQKAVTFKQNFLEAFPYTEVKSVIPNTPTLFEISQRLLSSTWKNH